MIEIGWDPNVHLGPITLAWHGIFTAVGIFFGVWLPIRLLRGRVSEEQAYSVATWGVVGGIIGARLFAVADRWEFYGAHPEQILAIWTGGIAIWGAAFGGVLAGFVVALRRRFPIGLGADAAIPGMALGFAIGRIGDIINGEHHAIACSGLPWCVGYTFPEKLGGLGQPGPVHPAVAYDLIVNLAIVGITLSLRRYLVGRPPQGRIFWIGALLYGVNRFFEGFLRVDDPVYAGGLRQDQVIGLAVVLAAIVMLGYLALFARRREPLPA